MSEQYGEEAGGREFQRVADELRARMTDGTYPLRGYLPAQRDLAKELGVSRDTVQRALRELQREGWIESRQGSGSRVLRTQRIHSPAVSRLPGRPVTLGPLIGSAFEEPEVTLDVYTLTSESLDAHIRLQAERIQAGQIAPRHIGVRMLLPADSVPSPYGRSANGRYDDVLRERVRGVTRRHVESLRSTLRYLRTTELVPSVDVRIRYAPLTPAFKLYLINKTEALHGFYEVYERLVDLDDGTEIEAVDVVGLGATLTHHVKSDDAQAQGTVFVETTQKWFDSVWDFLAEE
ncbi:winged helix-turn-helix domain-containing protein [Streptomyces anandii]|uniref:Winged helix-turn-helix domain-containing protein n=1 Tax=Streptomyces anandii TaxID=285454 RepID=A0ABW6H628_9ACTN